MADLSRHPEQGKITVEFSRVEGWRREEDSNPRGPKDLIAFEATAFNQTLPSLHNPFIAENQLKINFSRCFRLQGGLL